MENTLGFLDNVYYGTPAQTWLIAAAIFVVSLVVVWILRGFAIRRLRLLADQSEGEVAGLLAKVTAKTKLLLALFPTLLLGLQVLERIPTGLGWVHPAAVIALLLQTALWGDALIVFCIARYQREYVADDASRLTTLRAGVFLFRTVFFTIILLLAIDNIPGVEITALLASLGIGGIAIALALQNVLSDLFASLSITLDKPFVIGDFIIVGDLLGTVENIGLKTTRIRSLSGEQLVFSNNDLLSSRIRNFKRMTERRVVFSFGVTYQTAREKLERIPGIVTRIIQSQEKTRFDRAHFKEFGASALNFEVVYYVLSSDYNIYMDIQQAINLELYRALDELDVDFAYPTQTLHVHSVDSGVSSTPAGPPEESSESEEEAPVAG